MVTIWTAILLHLQGRHMLKILKEQSIQTWSCLTRFLIFFQVQNNGLKASICFVIIPDACFPSCRYFKPWIHQNAANLTVRRKKICIGYGFGRLPGNICNAGSYPIRNNHMLKMFGIHKSNMIRTQWNYHIIKVLHNPLTDSINCNCFKVLFLQWVLPSTSAGYLWCGNLCFLPRFGFTDGRYHYVPAYTKDIFIPHMAILIQDTYTLICFTLRLNFYSLYSGSLLLWLWNESNIISNVLPPAMAPSVQPEYFSTSSIQD